MKRCTSTIGLEVRSRRPDGDGEAARVLVLCQRCIRPEPDGDSVAARLSMLDNLLAQEDAGFQCQCIRGPRCH